MAKIIPLHQAENTASNAQETPRYWRNLLDRYLFDRLPLKKWIRMKQDTQLTEEQAAQTLCMAAFLESFFQSRTQEEGAAETEGDTMEGVVGK
jgi:hypothetical protein